MPEQQAEDVHSRLRHTRSTGCSCAVPAEGYKTKGFSQLVLLMCLSLYFERVLDCTALLLPLLHTLSLCCTYFIQGECKDCFLINNSCKLISPFSMTF